MTYGNKYFFLALLLSFLFIIGCEKKFNNFHYDLYDGFNIKGINNEVKLYKNNELIKIVNDDYNIERIKYNNDAVCVKLSNNEYYMIYYVDSNIFGPYTKESLNKTIKEDSTMIFTNDFQDILKMDGLYYE